MYMFSIEVQCYITTNTLVFSTLMFCIDSASAG